MKNYGFKPTNFDGSEYEFNTKTNSSLPVSFSYKKFMPPIINQGDRSICVPCSISAHLDWNYAVDHDGKTFKDNGVVLNDIYKARGDKSKDDGMMIKEALDFLRKDGVMSKSGLMKIRGYAKILSLLGLKYAIVMNGPCVGALKAYNESEKFWNKEYPDQICIGGHAVSIVGYNKDGFIIRNSWGRSWGTSGYTILPYEDANKFVELWTIYD